MKIPHFTDQEYIEYIERSVPQLTEQQAIEYADSGAWKELTDEEVVKLQFFQRRLCMNFGHFQMAMERVLSRSVFTHEFAEPGRLLSEYLGLCDPPSIEEIVGMLPENTIVLGLENGVK